MLVMDENVFVSDGFVHCTMCRRDGDGDGDGDDDDGDSDGDGDCDEDDD